MTHIINRLQFQFNCSDEEQAFNFRRNFGVTFQEEITKAVDGICSKYAGEEEWLRIDKLEIDLGYFSPYSFEKNFAAVFTSKFEKVLSQKLSGISPAQKKTSSAFSRTELLQYFLQTGMLPWWAGGTAIDINEIMVDVLTYQPEVIKEFFYSHRGKKNIWQRIAFQFSKQSKALIVSSIDELKRAKDIFISWVLVLNAILKNKVLPELRAQDEIIENILLENATAIFRHIKDVDSLLNVFQKNIAIIFAAGKTIIDVIIVSNQASFSRAYHQILSNEANEIISANIDDPQLLTQKDILLNEVVARATKDEEDVTAKYIVKHAGIILLSPFLKDFFTNLQLLDLAEWKNKDAQYRAVHLLKFLSTGEQKVPEYNLPLEKIICGLHIEEPLPLDLELREHEMNEAELLLESVIEHWKSLKNTSVNGLRESFLKRDGLLSEKENGWLLQVERKTLDVLIDSIPWGYSTVRLPWNYYLVHVEW